VRPPESAGARLERVIGDRLAPPGGTDGEAAGEDEKPFDPLALLDYASLFITCLRRRAIAAVLLAVLGVAATLLAVNAMPRTYRVDVVVLVQGDYLFAPLTTGSTDKMTTTKGVAEVILRRANLISLVRQTKLVERWKATRDPLFRLKDALLAHFRPPPSDDELVESLAYLLEHRLVAMSDERTVTIEVSWRDPDSAYQLAAAALESFLESRQLAETSAITDTVSILEAHVAQAREQVQTAVAAAELSRPKTPRRSPATPASVNAPAVNVKPGISVETLRLKGLLEAKRRAIQDIEQLRSRRLAELQAQYEEQKAVFAESHPHLVNLRESMQALSQDSTQLAELRREAEELETLYAASGGDPTSDGDRRADNSPTPPMILRELPTRDPREELDRQQLSNATNKYNALVDRLNSARLTLDTARGSFKYRYLVLRPPLFPVLAISPKTVPLVAGGVIASLLAGVVVALGLELRKGLIIQPWQVERLGGVRLIGAVPVTSGPEQIAAADVKR